MLRPAASAADGSGSVFRELVRASSRSVRQRPADRPESIRFNDPIITPPRQHGPRRCHGARTGPKLCVQHRWGAGGTHAKLQRPTPPSTQILRESSTKDPQIRPESANSDDLRTVFFAWVDPAIEKHLVYSWIKFGPRGVKTVGGVVRANFSPAVFRCFRPVWGLSTRFDTFDLP